jgi:hypothetical protein
MNYINKEPFNEDLDASDSTGLFTDNKWRQSVIENFKQIINDIKLLQLKPIENVCLRFLLLFYLNCF